MKKHAPDWFTQSEIATPEIMKRIAHDVSSVQFKLQVKSAPLMAHWFVLNTLSLANQANQDGMHANALAMTRQCIEAIGIIELGVCAHPEAETTLLKWDADRLSPGNLREWLQRNVWSNYGNGLWTEPWHMFMREFANAVQPYAHYSRNLAQWQLRVKSVYSSFDNNSPTRAILEITPQAYDAQKATRITLFHALLCYTLGRIWLAANPTDHEFTALMQHLGQALSKSHYLDGHETNWSQQFWALVWDKSGETTLE